MINRRLLRIKAMQAYYAYNQKGDSLLENALKELNKSILASYNLYLSLFCLLIKINIFAKQIIEIRRNKQLPSYEDLNPNTKFVDNEIIEKILNNKIIEKHSNNDEYNWSNDTELIKQLWTKIEASDFYKTYMNIPKSSLEEDKNILRNIINKTIINNEQIDKALEDKSIFWNDDLEYLLSVIIKNINTIPVESECIIVDSLYKSEEDERFGKNLLKRTILYSNEFDKIILDFLQKWDLDRIANLDRVILHLALCELLKMPDIPVKVTINEYLDIAKFYSTSKSNTFINGILDAVYNKHKKLGILNKSGKGLL